MRIRRGKLLHACFASVTAFAASPPTSSAQVPRTEPPSEWTLLPGKFAGTTPLVEVTVGKTKALFMLDTGSSYTFVDERWAREIGLVVSHHPRKQNELTDKAYLATLTLTIGDEPFTAIDVSCMRVSDMSVALGVEVMGGLGYDFLRSRVIRLDYAAERIQQLPSDRFTYAGPSRAIVPVTLGCWNRPKTTVLVSAEGSESFGVLAMFDTGYNGGLKLSSAIGRGLPIDETAPGETSTTLYGEDRSRALKPLSLRIGMDEFPSVAAKFREDPMRDDLDMNIGGEFLARFVVTIDYPRGRLILEPRTVWGFDVGLTAGTPESVGGLQVTAVVPDLPASLAGLRVHDEILRVQGETILERPITDLAREVRKALNAGTSLQLKVLRSGEEIDVTLHPLATPTAPAK